MGLSLRRALDAPDDEVREALDDEAVELKARLLALEVEPDPDAPAEEPSDAVSEAPVAADASVAGDAAVAETAATPTRLPRPRLRVRPPWRLPSVSRQRMRLLMKRLMKLSLTP